MSDIYKNILNEIAKPMISLNETQMDGVIRKMKKGSMDDRLAASSLERLNNYINLSLQIAKEQRERLEKMTVELADEYLESEDAHIEVMDDNMG